MRQAASALAAAGLRRAVREHGSQSPWRVNGWVVRLRYDEVVVDTGLVPEAARLPSDSGYNDLLALYEPWIASYERALGPYFETKRYSGTSSVLLRVLAVRPGVTVPAPPRKAPPSWTMAELSAMQDAIERRIVALPADDARLHALASALEKVDRLLGHERPTQEGEAP
jgi:hypothetical protein